MKNKIINEILNSITILNFPDVNILIEKPKNKDNGDIATNVAFQLAKKLKKNPIDIANQLQKELIKSELFKSVDVANPGFLNFRLNTASIGSNLEYILNKNHNFGKNTSGSKKKVLIEFVSANPTGPLTVGHGRGAILGDTISNILSWNGYDIYREYYYNNAGRQMRVLGESLKARYYELLDQSYPFPDGGYEGEYIKDIAKVIIKENGEKLLSHNEDNNIFRSFAEKHIFKNIKETLDSLGLQFDNYFNENQLYENKKIYEVINRLKEKDLIYEKDNATWFKTSELGLPADRVLIKSTGEPTYRLPDIAYHMTKFERGFDMCVDIFGADHMDAYPDVLAALNQLDFNDKDVKVLIHQFVSIVNHGDVVKMSTRKGNFITLERLIKDVGIDVVRYFFIMRSINSHLNFDLEIAKEKSENNPVYYIQYAHARICTILEKYNSENNALDVNLDLLEQDTEIKLIYKMVEFEELILKLGSNLEPQILANYLFDLATSFHKYYAHHKIISDNAELSVARIYLINCIRIVIRNGLTILGIGCPKKM
jgi:arginyl-tRNA synthetase